MERSFSRGQDAERFGKRKIERKQVERWEHQDENPADETNIRKK